ncbi:hypothetical protein IFM89_035901 [Coptis chinensis]|uniref:F-box domain-containing protein n=1 Tax=Coptis chinensis TaxID=261450 RepID=A0A835H2W6_9MAGN|nr:hypothetical protein IFM89_035901 [Coptis chinensis]
MTTESCNSRSFSRLMKSCFPDTTQSEHHLIHISKKLPTQNHLNIQTSFFSLPDDLLLECLSRVPHSSLSSISLVCRKWSHLIDTQVFYNLRRSHGLVCTKILAISLSGLNFYVASYRIGHDSVWSVTSIRNLETILPEILDGSVSHSRLVAVERYIFILSRNITLRYDTWTGGFILRSPMLFPRKKFAAAYIAGKIYVSGGAASTGTVEEYDLDTDTWRVVGESSRRRYGCIGVSVDGIFYIIGGLKINNRNEMLSREGNGEARGYACTMDLYDVDTRVWLRSRKVPGGGCVVAGCGVGGQVFVLTSHAVELSFWKFDGRRKSGGFGEWCRMKSPPLPAQVRLDNRVRFCCVGVGEEKVVLVQVLGCIDDLLRRSGRNCRGMKEGLVLVYDCEIGEWSRELDLPQVIRRADCVSVDC